MAKKTFEEKLIKRIEEGDDEEVLELFALFLDRVRLGTQLVEDDEELIIGEVMTMVSGTSLLTSDIRMFPWPLQYLPTPEAFKDKVN